MALTHWACLHSIQMRLNTLLCIIIITFLLCVMIALWLALRWTSSVLFSLKKMFYFIFIFVFKKKVWSTKLMQTTTCFMFFCLVTSSKSVHFKNEHWTLLKSAFSKSTKFNLKQVYSIICCLCCRWVRMFLWCFLPELCFAFSSFEFCSVAVAATVHCLNGFAGRPATKATEAELIRHLLC